MKKNIHIHTELQNFAVVLTLLWFLGGSTKHSIHLLLLRHPLWHTFQPIVATPVKQLANPWTKLCLLQWKLPLKLTCGVKHIFR